MKIKKGVLVQIKLKDDGVVVGYNSYNKKYCVQLLSGEIRFYKEQQLTQKIKLINH